MFSRWLSYQQPSWLIIPLFLIGLTLDVQRMSKPCEKSLPADFTGSLEERAMGSERPNSVCREAAYRQQEM